MHQQSSSVFLRNFAGLAGAILGGALLAGCGQVVTSGMIDLAPPPMSYAVDARTPALGAATGTPVPGEKRAGRAALR